MVRRNTFMVGKTEVTVSTVFLGIDHGVGPPVLWETLILLVSSARRTRPNVEWIVRRIRR